jgi:UDP-N-acetylmuramyl pentapeptide phosphotransferase/UDP-N-acetylglucosamine-1-phosphate transferase
MPHAVFYTVWCLTAVFGSAALTRQLIDWARARGMLDLPNERGSHALPTPRGGGLAIVAVVSAAIRNRSGRWPARCCRRWLSPL